MRQIVLNCIEPGMANAWKEVLSVAMVFVPETLLNLFTPSARW